MPELICVHYGHHPGTTGSHFAEAAERLQVGFACREEHRSHLRISDVATGGPYLWIESGVTSLPVDPHDAPVTTAGYLIDAHLHPELSVLQAQLFDVVFVAQRDLLSIFKTSHPCVQWLPLAAPKQLISLPRRYRFEASFVGNLWSSTPREALMREVGKNFVTNDWSKPHSVEEMGEAYSQSKIVVNPAINKDLNMRFFEALACGAVVIMPELDNGVSEIAVENRDYFMCDFYDPAILIHAMKEILSGPVEGSKGRDLIAAGHTYDHRIRQILHVVRAAGRGAPIRAMSEYERTRLFLELSREYEDIKLLACTARNNPREVRHQWRSAADSLKAASWKWGKERVKQYAPRLAAAARRRLPMRPKI